MALGIAVFALVVMFGLLSVGVASSTASFEQTVATDILSSVAADLRSAPASRLVTGGIPLEKRYLGQPLTRDAVPPKVL